MQDNVILKGSSQTFNIHGYTAKAFGECVYPVMFQGEKVGQEKYDKLKEVLGFLETFVADGKFSAGNDEVRTCYTSILNLAEPYCSVQMTIGDIALVATYSSMKASGLEQVLSVCAMCCDFF